MSSNWCSKVADNTPINELAIPGTHDAAAWTHDWNEWGLPGTWAQRKNITEQLALGIRVLDLRVGYAWGFGRWVGMFHGPVYLDRALQEVLDDIRAFLEGHPEELVILIVQQQGKPPQSDVSGDVRNLITTTFGERFFPFEADRLRWPTVGELRGRVMVMARLRSQVEGFCDVRSWLTLGDNTDGQVINAGENLRIYLQDRYKGLSAEDGFVSMGDDNRKKFAKVKAAARAHCDVPSARLLRINHLSYSNLRYQPWQSGEGVNRLLRESYLPIKGVVMIDDADQATVNYILVGNAGAFR